MLSAVLIFTLPFLCSTRNRSNSQPTIKSPNSSSIPWNMLSYKQSNSSTIPSNMLSQPNSNIWPPATKYNIWYPFITVNNLQRRILFHLLYYITSHLIKFNLLTSRIFYPNKLFLGLFIVRNFLSLKVCSLFNLINLNAVSFK